MTAEKRQRANQIVADAFTREPSQRLAFVENASHGDMEVRAEVLRLLDDGERLTTITVVGANRLPSAAPASSLAVGQQLAARFRIDRFLGVGGMGEVYAATDQELGEQVALKTIRPNIAASPIIIEKFKLEVKESRRITHASVCRVYDLFSHEQPRSDPMWFLTMELLEGKTLQQALAERGRFPLQEAIPLMRDIVDGLSTAHGMGIVHRDFKPSNVMLVKRGGPRERAVVMDFGLALDVSAAPAAGQSREGTPAYMAPEQANGGAIGFAADQYSVGLVICELLTGNRPALSRETEARARRQLEEWFTGPSGRILQARTRGALARALEFQPERRFRHVSELLPILDGSRQRTRRRWTAGLAAMLGAAAVAVAVAAAGASLKVTGAVRLTPESGLSTSASISLDGKWIVYSSDRGQPGNLDIFIQSNAGGSAKRLTTHSAEDNEPSVSPDGKLVAFHSERDGGGLYVVGADGAGERLLAPGGWSPAFSPDGRSLAYWMGTRDDAAPSARLFTIPAEGGAPRRLAADFADARYPTWDSTGQRILFDGCKTSKSALATCTEWWVIRTDGTGARNTGALAFVKAQKIELVTPPKKGWRGDQVIFSGSRDPLVGLWALRLSHDATRPVGLPQSITPGDSGEREPGIAGDGATAFVRITAALHLWKIPLKAGSAGAATTAPVTDDPSLDGCPGISRDGRWLYFNRRLHGVRQLMVRDLAGNRESVLYASGENKFWPVASESGDRVVFEMRHESHSSLWLASRGGETQRLCTGCSHPTSWFAKDKAVFYTTSAGEIAMLDVASGATRVVLTPEPTMVLGGADWSPVNEHLLFTAGRQGAAKQAFAVHFPAKAGAPTGPWKELTGGQASIDQPHWSADGSEFYFFSKRDASNCVWGSRFSARNPAGGTPFPVVHYHDLKTSPDRASPLTRGLTVSADGLYLTVGEVSGAVWLGKLYEPRLATLWTNLFFWR